MKTLFFALLILLSLYTTAQPETYQVIDMHLHVYSEDGRWNAHIPNPRTGQPMIADNPQKHYDATMAEMKKWNYKKAVISGDDTTSVFLWKDKNPDLFITGLAFRLNNLPDTNWLRNAFEKGKIKVLGEIYVQLDGVAPDSLILEPYYSLAERYDIPVGIHIGPGPQGAPYRGTPKYRMKLSNALALEDVLLKHPKMRIYVMHAGWPLADEMIALMYAHPQVYVDIAVIDWTRPTENFHDYLRRLVEAGFGKRIMFGSDQMVWPEAISIALNNVLSVTFLTEEQKQDILYRNAEQFLKMK
jgi:predicted TIM-barrel fold metal-dependent hydrolase